LFGAIVLVVLSFYGWKAYRRRTQQAQRVL
jgi:hypothetical protein